MGDEVSSAVGGFRAIRVSGDGAGRAAPHEARSGYRLFRGKGGFEAAIPESVVQRCLLLGRRSAPNEWYGLVVGRVFEHEGHRHVVVLGVVPDADAKCTPNTVETSHSSEFRARMAARDLFPDGTVIGWIHGHLRHGPRFSATDRRTQASWKQPHALGIVVDPWDPEEVAVYRGPESELLARSGSAPAPVVPPPEESRWRRNARVFARKAKQSVRRAARRLRAIAPHLAFALFAAFLALLARTVSAMEDRLSAVEGAGASAPPRPKTAPASEPVAGPHADAADADAPSLVCGAEGE